MAKPVRFLGNSQGELRAFPADAREDSGYQLYRVQLGLPPDDFKPLVAVGAGVCEIRVRERSGAYRVVFVATLPEAIYVLHAFQKKSSKTSGKDLALVRARFRRLARSRP